MSKKNALIGRLLLAGSLVVVVERPCPAQATQPTTPAPVFVPAIEGQKRVLAELGSILQEEKVMLSDGAVQLALETLLSDEQKQAEAIRELGRRTLGRTAEELSAEDRAERDRLFDGQDILTDRYRRLEKGMENKATIKPDSVYTGLLAKAADSQLLQTMEDAGRQVRANQLSNALRSTNKVIEVLREMVAMASQKAGSTQDMDNTNGDGGFMAPSLRYKGAAEKLAEFNWIGASADPLGHILRGLRLLEELTERQRAVAAATKTQAASKQASADLAKTETDIRRQALEVGAKLALLDPQIDQLIRKATASIDKARPAMEQGPLSDAVEPARRAADELAAATEYLRKLWQDILSRLKQHTQEAAAIEGAGGGIPHGMSKAQVEQIQKMVTMLLRATAALARVADAQTAILDRTRLAASEPELPSLKPDQEALAGAINNDVVPFDVSASQLPRDMLPQGVAASVNPVGDLLKDAVDRIGKAADALSKPDRAEAVKRESESLQAMTTAMDLMIKALQKLLGQLAPSAITPSGPGAAGMALDPSGGGRQAGGWLFGLPSQQQESVRQAFRETFPRRYDRAIKLYYQSIAREQASDGNQ
ncbi:MAG TPA: hypothetical protein PLL20_07065 [Phycisphaerae bacterium]|nr:hypothetical protein [Phycisphaerae bacterium]HRR83471.1 hypothetical protein [Phycisphaerae bacterium]